MKTILKRCDADPEVITKEHILQKAHELNSLQVLLQTHVIKKSTFYHNVGQSATLTIFAEKKMKEKKKKQKKNNKSNNSDTDSEAIQ